MHIFHAIGARVEGMFSIQATGRWSAFQKEAGLGGKEMYGSSRLPTPAERKGKGGG